MDDPAVASLESWLAPFAAAIGQVQQVFDASADDLTDRLQIASLSVRLDFLMAVSRTAGVSFGIVPLNAGIEVAHGLKREEANCITFDIVAAPVADM